MMTNTKMSLFNRYSSDGTILYKKHIIENVFWDDSLGANLNKGYENADKVNVFIPFNKNDMSNYVNSKQYNGTGWTLQDGDFMIKGEVNINEVSGIKELKDYEVFIITVRDMKDFGSFDMQHFELRGK